MPPQPPPAMLGVADQPFGTLAPQGLVAWIIERTRRAGTSWSERRLAFALRRVALARLAGRAVDMETLGARMRLSPYNNVCESRLLFMPQFFDPAERAAIAARLRPGFIFIDVGANIGGYALSVAAMAGPTARIIAVEPQPDIYARLVTNIRLNSFATVKALACAMTDRDGEVALFVDSANRGESSVKIIGSDDGAHPIHVPAMTLLRLIGNERLDRVDAVKIDVEGAEDIILDAFFRAAPETLWPQLLILERGGARWHMDLMALLAQCGYATTLETKGNVLLERARSR